MKKIISLLLAIMLTASFAVISEAYDYVSREGWEITASSIHTNPNWPPERMIDGNPDTYWHSNYDESGTPIDKPPMTVTLTMPDMTSFSGFSYAPRQDNPSGIVTEYNFYVSDEYTGKAELIYSGSFEGDKEIKNVSFGYNISAKTVVFEILAGNYNYGTCAEFNLLVPSGAVSKTIKEASLGKSIEIGASGASEEDMAPTLPREGWTVTSSSVHPVENWMPERMLDGNVGTYWHSSYDNDGNRDMPPYRLTFTLPKAEVISGFSYVPRNDNPTGIVTAYNIYASETDDGKEERIYYGTMDNNKRTKFVDFGFNIKVKKVVFEITEANYNYGSCAEFYLHEGKEGYPGMEGVKKEVQKDGEKIRDKSGWTATASSAKGHYPARYAIDGRTETIWHTDYTDDGQGTILSIETCPHTLEITLPETTVISGFSYTPRSESGGRVFAYEFYITDADDGEWFKISEGRFDNNDAEKTVSFLGNTAVKKVMFKVTDAQSGYAVTAELDLLSENEEFETFSDYNEFLENYNGNRLIKISTDEMTATASSVWRAGHEGKLVVDGDIGSAWHSHPDDKGKYPFVLSVDLGAKHSVSQIMYYPRKDANGAVNGTWQDYSIWAGDDPENLELVLENAEIPADGQPHAIEFDEPVNARYYEFEISKGVNGYATCCELSFYERLADSVEENKAEYTLKIGSKIIKIKDDDGEREVETDVAPYIDGGYTQIPLRGLLEQMGAEFEWDGEYNRIKVTADGKIIEMQIFNNIVYVTNNAYGRVRYTLRSVPQIKDSRTFVPLRFISENLGYTVQWVAETQEIIITK